MKYTYHKNFGEIYDFQIVYSHLFSGYGQYQIKFDCYCIDDKKYNFDFVISTNNTGAIDEIKDLISDGEDYSVINKFYHETFFDEWLFSAHADKKIELFYPI